MGRIYNALKNIRRKIYEQKDYKPFQTLIEKFIVLVTYEDTYLMNKLQYTNDGNMDFTLKENGKDMFINCGKFGILIDKEDKVSIHT